MKAQEKLKKIEDGMWGMRILAIIVLITPTTLLLFFVTPENMSYTVLVGLLVMVVIVRWLNQQCDRQWKNSFIKEFEEINTEPLENTRKHLGAQYGSHDPYPFRQIARALVISLQDEQDGTPVREFGKSVLETYRYFDKISK